MAEPERQLPAIRLDIEGYSGDVVAAHVIMLASMVRFCAEPGAYERFRAYFAGFLGHADAPAEVRKILTSSMAPGVFRAIADMLVAGLRQPDGGEAPDA